MDRQEQGLPQTARTDAETVAGASGGTALERGILTLQGMVGNAAVAAVVQRQPGRPDAPSRPPRGSSRIAEGTEADIANFATYVELATTAEALATGRFDSAVAFNDPKLARAFERLTWVVSVVANPGARGGVLEASRIWDEIRPAISWGLADARRRGLDPAAATTGISRLERQLVRIEAAELARAGEQATKLAAPDAGLHEERDVQLGRSFTALSTMIKEGEGVIQWNDRHLLRALTAAQVATLTDGQVRMVNLGRTAIGWAALWEEYQSLGDRYEAARKRGLLDRAATLADFVNHATSVLTETANAVVRVFQTSAAAKAAAYAAASRAAGVGAGTAAEGVGFMDDAIAEVNRARWQGRADAFGVMRYAAGFAGAVQIVSSTLNLIRAIRDEDLRAGVGAGHGIAQGGITLGGAITGASTAATTMLSSSVAVVWITMETLFDIAELSAWGRRQQAIEEIARPLRGASSLIPWGKRMGGVADALLRIETTEPGHRAALEERLLASSSEAFDIVLDGMLGVATFIQRRPDLAPVMGPEASAALEHLELMRYRSGDVGPGDIQMLTELCVPIFVGLQRVGQWAIAKYGEARERPEMRARVRALGAGEPI